MSTVQILQPWYFNTARTACAEQVPHGFLFENRIMVQMPIVWYIGYWQIFSDMAIVKVMYSTNMIWQYFSDAYNWPIFTYQHGNINMAILHMPICFTLTNKSNVIVILGLTIANLLYIALIDLLGYVNSPSLRPKENPPPYQNLKNTMNDTCSSNTWTRKKSWLMLAHGLIPTYTNIKWWHMMTQYDLTNDDSW